MAEISPNYSSTSRNCLGVTPNTLRMSMMGSGVSNFFRDDCSYMLTMKTSSSPL